MDSGIGTSLWGLLRSIWKKTVLITGSSRGIGLALAAHYTAAGWGVIGAVQNPAEADKLRSLHPAKIVQLDTSDDDSIRRAAKTLDDQAIDLVINNAGIAMFDDINTVTSESMIRQFTVNAVGPFLVSRAFTPHLKAAVAKQGEAKLVHITSSLGSITRHNGTGAACPGYRTSKAALNMIHMDLTHALKTENITCAAICPGNVATDLNNYTGSLTPTESVAAVVKVIDRLKFEDTGKLKSLQPFKIVQLDSSDEASILRAAKELDGLALDLVINNAGIAMVEDFATITAESMTRHFTVNALGPFLVSRAFTPHLQAAVAKSSEAKLLQITSGLGSIKLNDSPFLPGYRVSKAALNMVHMNLTHELKPHKIICAAVHPGRVATEGSGHNGELTPDESAAELAKVIEQLTSDDTGKFLNYAGDELPW
ncbi:hypothetical protein Poli38472_007147 [Pythium oligandrum]|uniref:Uncharacterized protein n=1 Tax=Pythium oligandrum TaxID=41045 RepID=A0A8K1C9F5_PYTOL|nr:hypothetical protein Poli38472_007147 [Pythium oligandrum]|eukprot:TMW59002.1 hypothetical protein Poli38472_007147 [Pythium oligandrum]